MKELIEKLKTRITELSANPAFIHHRWFVKYHLEIAAKIALEICDNFFPQADRDFVEVLVWFHDYGKIVDFDRQYQASLEEGKGELLEIGFEPDFVDRVIAGVRVFDQYRQIDLCQESIEIQIASSADGASHLVGPFYYIWFLENPDHSIPALMQENINKAKGEWERKIVLGIVKEYFTARYNMLLEQSGKFPESFFSV